MSSLPAEKPRCDTHPANPCLETIVVPRARDLGGFEVRRVLPSSERRMVGPFIFFDQMGPADFAPGQGLDVRPHPHIGLATLTYLFEGTILHRDSLGNEQLIRPGEVNWMTAGRGIVHSERSDRPSREAGGRLFGIQSWVALPLEAEESEPGFWHHTDASLPMHKRDGVELRLIAGTYEDLQSPVATPSPTLYADVQMAPAATMVISAGHAECGIYPVAGAVKLEGVRYDAGQLLVFKRGLEVRVEAVEATRLMLLGGAPLEGKRHIWWNFVSSSRERIEQAKHDWKGGGFGAVPGDDEFIPLPE